METPPITQGSGDHKTAPLVAMVMTEKKKLFEEQPGASGVPPVMDHLIVTSKSSTKKFFSRKGGECVCMCVCPAVVGYFNGAWPLKLLKVFVQKS